jgi:hypothetical protein
MAHSSRFHILWPSLVAAAAFGAYGARASHTVGSVRSSSSFRLSGTTVPVEGTRSWPVVAGDEIVAGPAPATLELSDGSRVSLAAEARVKIEAQKGRTTVRLLDGALQYQLSDTATTDLYNRSERARASSGTLTTPGTRPSPKPPGRGRPAPPPSVSPWR